MAEQAPRGGPGRGALTARQREIAALIARGYTNQQVASELVISRGTVANHLEQILRRLNLGSRVELATWATQHGMAESENRLLTTLERLLEIDPRDMESALEAATTSVAAALGADKADAFLYEAASATLVARGTSQTPLGRKQHQLGLDILPLANGGRMVNVYQTGTPCHSGRVDLDASELRGIRVGLGVRSDIAVPLVVGGQRRGVLSVVSTSANYFTERDARFLATVSRWVGIMVQRAELTQQSDAEARAESRRETADELVTVLAHDFRNLLFPIRARLELIARRAGREGHAQYVADAGVLVRSVDRLDSLVRDLLDTARLDQGVFQLECVPLDLADLLRQTAAEFGASVSITTRTEANEPVVWAEPSRMRQVFENLLSNALKVQPPGQPVEVELATEQGWAIVTVSDRGPGIPANVRSRLFERFAAGSSSAGLGIGLYLARGITQAHGGSLEADSHSPAGSSFVVRLPLESPSAAEPPCGGGISREPVSRRWLARLQGHPGPEQGHLQGRRSAPHPRTPT